MYERLCWNSRAKERELKLQMRKHLSTRLNQLSHSITMNCDSQVQRYNLTKDESKTLSVLILNRTVFVFREVNEILNRLQCLTNEAHQEMKIDVDKLQKEVADLEKIAKSLVHTK